MKEQNLAHNVFFTLKNKSGKAADTLVEDCYSYLKDIPGIIFFSAGSLVPEHNRDVNIRDFQVGLHVIFIDKNYHDQYQVAEKHNIFVERNKDNWEQIRVFDTYIR